MGQRALDRQRDGVRLADGYLFRPSALDEYSIVEGKPLSARVRCERGFVIERGDWRTRIRSDSTMTSDATAFHVTNVLEAFADGERVFAKTWRFTVPRTLV